VGKSLVRWGKLNGKNITRIAHGGQFGGGENWKKRQKRKGERHSKQCKTHRATKTEGGKKPKEKDLFQSSSKENSENFGRHKLKGEPE